MSNNKPFLEQRKDTHRTPPEPVWDLDRELYLNTRAEVLTGYSDVWWACVELGYWVTD